jgi:hypothetical protein
VAIASGGQVVIVSGDEGVGEWQWQHRWQYRIRGGGWWPREEEEAASSDRPRQR